MGNDPSKDLEVQQNVLISGHTPIRFKKVEKSSPKQFIREKIDLQKG